MKPTRDEHWLPIPGYEGLYEVSDQGRVKSLDRMRPFQDGYRPIRGRVLKPWQPKAGSRLGYWSVLLSRDGAVKHRAIHSLVAEAFIGPRPEGMHVCHDDGDLHNNRVENLRYDTPSENSRDVVRHGRHYKSNNTHCPQGHEYTPENTRYFPSAPRARRCRKCIDIHNQELIERRRRRAALKES